MGGGSNATGERGESRFHPTGEGLCWGGGGGRFHHTGDGQ